MGSYMKNDSVEKNFFANIPIFAVTGTNGKTTTVRLLYHLLTKLGFNTGLACTGYIALGDKKLEEGDTTGFLSTRAVLMNTEIEAAVLEVARGGILKDGLGFENISSAIITSLSEDHLGIDGVNTVEELGRVKSVILEEVNKEGKWVLRAQSEIIQAAKNCKKKDVEIILFEIDKNSFINEHLEAGGEAFYLDGDHIIFHNKNQKVKLTDIKEIAFTHHGMSRSNILNVMSSIAALTTLNIDLTIIVDKLKTIKCDLDFNPGRQNIIRGDKFSLILDYGHNSEAYKEIFYLAGCLKPSKITSIITAPGDRTDKHIEELGYLAGSFSNKVIVREQSDLRGSDYGRVASLLRNGAIRSGLKESYIYIVNDASEALSNAINDCVQDETIIIFIEDLGSIFDVIEPYLKKNKL